MDFHRDRARSGNLDKHVLLSQWPGYDEDQMRHSVETAIGAVLAQRSIWRRALAALANALFEARADRVPARYRAGRIRRLVLARADRLLDEPTRNLLALALDGVPLKALSERSTSHPDEIRRVLLCAQAALLSPKPSTTTTP